MKIYIIERLYDNSAYITQKVCLTKEIARRELIKLQKKKNDQWRITYRVQEEKVMTQ